MIVLIANCVLGMEVCPYANIWLLSWCTRAIPGAVVNCLSASHFVDVLTDPLGNSILMSVDGCTIYHHDCMVLIGNMTASLCVKVTLMLHTFGKEIDSKVGGKLPASKPACRSLCRTSGQLRADERVLPFNLPP